MLRIDSIDVYYGQIQALYGVSLHIPEGKIVALLGANGAGKTSTLKTISGLLEAKRGSIEFMGKPIQKMPAEQIVSAGIVQVPEGRQVLTQLTVEENLKLGAYSLRDKSTMKRDMNRVVELFPKLGQRMSQMGGTLSGGEQQMVAIGRAIMAKPRLLLLDEPSLGLAPLVIKDIFETLKRINSEGTTILVVEQNANLALKTAHLGYVLENGKVILGDTAQRLLANEEVKKAYLGG